VVLVVEIVLSQPRIFEHEHEYEHEHEHEWEDESEHFSSMIRSASGHGIRRFPIRNEQKVAKDTKKYVQRNLWEGKPRAMGFSRVTGARAAESGEESVQPSFLRVLRGLLFIPSDFHPRETDE
jgi:hypothetical protein